MSERNIKITVCIVVLILSVLTISFQWDKFLSGLKLHSLDHFIASLYLFLLFLAALIILLSQGRRAGQKSESSNKSRDFFARLARKKLSCASIIVLFLIFSVALLSPIVSPSDPDVQPDTVALRYLHPFSHVFILIKSDGSEIYANEFHEKSYEISFRRSDIWESLNKSELYNEGKEGWFQKKYFILGTDKFGRDIVSRIIYGSRVSLAIGILAVLIAATFGSLLGSVSGFFGSAIDAILMRIVDIMLSFPRIFLILLIVALFKPSLSITIAVLGATGWMGVSRLVRSQTLSLREADFVKAAQAMGQKSSMIILKHLIPNTSSTIIVDSTLRVGNTILIEASLSFLGLGVQPPTPSWGSIISDGRDALLDGWWISTFPGLALVITVIAFNLLGDAIREALMPRSAKP